MRRSSITAALIAMVLLSCSPPDTTAPSPTVAASPTPSAGPAEPASQPTAAGDPEFSSSVSMVDTGLLTHSWRPGCPVTVEDLRLLTLTHWGFDGLVHTGELVVARDQASNIVTVMRRLFDLRFPIDRMELVDSYGGDDARSMAANNTSAFNCREVESSPGSWSEHAYGRAIDINPVQNPYIPRTGPVQPPAGQAYTERSDRRPGMIVADDDVVAAFRSVGWEWGGNWTGSKDYQHFSSTGR